MRGNATVAVAVAAALVGGVALLTACGTAAQDAATSTSPAQIQVSGTQTATFAEGADISTVMTPPPASPSRQPSTPTSTPGVPQASAAGCNEAPARIVEIINAAFTDGEHLEMTQSVAGPSGMVIVGGNIVDPDGERVSSADSWVMSGGAVYGLSSDARRHTLLPDGRDVIPDNWTTYNDAVGECVVAAMRNANR